MESTIAETVVRALQELKVATYDSIRWFDKTYTLDSYKSALWGMEGKEQVKRKVFQTGKNERYIWFLPWYEDDATEKIEELAQEIIASLAKCPLTAGEIRQYFREKHPAYHQIGYLALRSAIDDGRIVRCKFNDGIWKTVYDLPNMEGLHDLEAKVLQSVNNDGFAFAQDISSSLNVSRPLAYTLLAKLAYDGKITRFKVAWNYARNVPIFAYCKEGFEAKAFARFRQLIQERTVQRKRDRIVEEYLSKFKGASAGLKADESLPDLAISYFEKLLWSGFIRGRETAVVAWSSYYLASKILRQGITPGDIESYAKLSKASPYATERNKIRKKTPLLNMVKDANEFLDLSAPDLYSHPNDYLAKIVGKMKLTEKLESSKGVSRRDGLIEDTANLISKFPRELFFGKRSESLAAAALYLTASHQGVVECTQQRISKAADITEVTLRNTIHAIVATLSPKIGSNGNEDLHWIQSFGSVGVIMKAKGLKKYKDKLGRNRWGTHEEVQQWSIQDAMTQLFGETESSREENFN